MKAVMLSIQPKWCKLIAAGEKTLEVRKSRPKIETPFKCYIYCTIDGFKSIFQKKPYLMHNRHVCNGKVIGEFICDHIYQYTTSNCIEGTDITTEQMTAMSRLTRQELEKYELSAEPKENYIYMIGLYGWHISDLKIYDKPKGLHDFSKPQGECHRGCEKEDCIGCWDCLIKRPPQSWCYVEEDSK